MKTKSPSFDRLVARYYPAVYSFAARLTDDPRDAIALTRQAFSGARNQVAKNAQPDRDRNASDCFSSTCRTGVRLI